jgi:hypothetical protein
MESWGVSYESIMEIPSSRRVRLIKRKSELEKKRAQDRENASKRRR